MNFRHCCSFLHSPPILKKKRYGSPTHRNAEICAELTELYHQFVAANYSNIRSYMLLEVDRFRYRIPGDPNALLNQSPNLRMKYFIRWKYDLKELPPGLAGNMSQIVIANDEASGLDLQTYYGMAGYKLKQLKIPPYTPEFEARLKFFPHAEDFYAGKAMPEQWLREMVRQVNFILADQKAAKSKGILKGALDWKLPEDKAAALNSEALGIPFPTRSEPLRHEEHYQAQPGDTLHSISEMFYGNDSYWALILVANRSLHNRAQGEDPRKENFLNLSDSLTIPAFPPDYKPNFHEWTFGFYPVRNQGATLAQVAKVAYGSAEAKWVNLLLAANWEQVTSIGGLQRRQWLIIPMDSAAALQANSKILASPKLEPGDLFQGQRISSPSPTPSAASPQPVEIIQPPAPAESCGPEATQCGHYKMGNYHFNAVIQGIYGLFFESDPMKWCKIEQNTLKKEILEANVVNVSGDVWSTQLPLGVKMVKLPQTRFANQLSISITNKVDQYLKEHLSGKHWYAKLNTEAHGPKTDLALLKDDFESKVRKFKLFLEANGANILVSTTERDHTRALAMHWCFLLGVEHKPVPRGFKDVDFTYSGSTTSSPNLHFEAFHRKNVKLPVIWDHGDDEVSWAEAAKMCAPFQITHRPAPASPHLRGMAIDMNINNLQFGSKVVISRSNVFQNGDLLEDLKMKILEIRQENRIGNQTVESLKDYPKMVNGVEFPAHPDKFIIHPEVFFDVFGMAFSGVYDSRSEKLELVLVKGSREPNIAYNSRLVWIAKVFFDVEKLMDDDRTDHPHWQTTYH